MTNGNTPVNWRIGRIGDVLAFYCAGDPFLKLEYTSDGIPVLAKGDVKPFGRLQFGGERFVEASLVEMKRYRLTEPGDMILTTRDLTQAADFLGLVAPVPADTAFLVNQGANVIRLNANVDPRYFVYWCNSPVYRAYMKGCAVGSTQIHMRKGDFFDAPIFLPSLPEQRAIAHILGTLDDKIELNRRMNQTLEEMARALFHSWFVAFDPVRAKAAGRQPAGMDAATAALFPDSFVQTEHGEIPAGWRFVPIGDAVRAVGGSTPRTAQPEYWDGDIAFCTPKDLSTISSPVLLDTARHITDAGAATISSGILPIGTVLMSSRAPIGYLAITALETTVNQGMIALICEGPLPNDYVYLWARQNMDAIKGRANGTTFLEVSKRNFRPIPVLVPGQAMLASFSRLVAPMFRRVETNERESLSLAAIRDALLPKLLAGEMRLSESEGLVPVGSAMRETG